MDRRRAAITKAEDRFDAVARRFETVYAMPLPRHVTYCAAFFLGLEDADRAAAERLDANGLFGVGEWFRDGALEKRPWADERLHGRFRRDPPELVTFVSGGSDGSHWGLWYDDPKELPRLVAHNWARDSAETGACEPTLLASILKRQSPIAPPRAIAEWLADLVDRERAAHQREQIAAPHPRSSWCVGGMGPMGVRLPDDWTSQAAERERYDAYRADDPRVLTWIQQAKDELARGEPGRALLLGRELHWMDRDPHRAACTVLLAGAYRALGRDALAGVTEAHHAARDMPSVDVYSVSSSPFFLAVQRGDADEVARHMLDPRIDAGAIETASYAARSPAVQDLLIARVPEALRSVLGAALYRASPTLNADQHQAAAMLIESRARGETMEALLKRALDQKQYRAWRALADHGDALDVEAWQRDARRLVERAIAADGRVEPTCTALIAAQLFPLAEELIEKAEVGWADAKGTSLLHAAARAGAVAITERLLARGANASLADAQGRTPRDLARETWQRDKAVGSRLLELLRPPDEAPPSPPPSDALVVGDTVAHKKFGQGRIEAVSADGKLTIAFADVSRVLIPKFVERVRV